MYRFRVDTRSPVLFLSLLLICFGLYLSATYRPMILYSGQYVSFSLDKADGKYLPGEAVDLWVRVGGTTDEGITYASSVTITMRSPSGQTTNLPVVKITDNGRWWNSKFNAPSSPGTYVITVTETGYMGTQSVSGNLYVVTSTTTNQTTNQTQPSTNQTQPSTNQTTSQPTNQTSGTQPAPSPASPSSFDWLFQPNKSFFEQLISAGLPESLASILSIPVMWIFIGLLLIALLRR